MRKIYTWEIRYIKDGEVISEFEYSKLYGVKKYIEILTGNMDVSSLKIFRNSEDFTGKINLFLYK